MDANLAERRINIIQGEQRVDSDPRTILTTILGSCVAACMWDAEAGIGGMNHFLLPGEEGDIKPVSSALASQRYGVHLMELLVNALLKKGAQRSRLQAKLFGGARMIRGLTDVGEKNAAFAEKFLQAEGIRVTGGSLRGEQGRRIQFWPSTGRARQILLEAEKQSIFQEERRMSVPKPAKSLGSVELF